MVTELYILYVMSPRVADKYSSRFTCPEIYNVVCVYVCV